VPVWLSRDVHFIRLASITPGVADRLFDSAIELRPLCPPTLCPLM
jgi:hypothetical protein